MKRIDHPTEVVFEYSDGSHVAHTRNEVIYRCPVCKRLDHIGRCGICGSTDIQEWVKKERVSNDQEVSEVSED
jgi:predicted RNA-binding Zn-ribbon protein involved in translation (DUF1610 family)